MKKLKFLACSLLLWLPASWAPAQQAIFFEGFEDHEVNCGDFVDGCVAGWINTHGTANVDGNNHYQGDWSAHCYVTKNNNCLSYNTEDQGEGMALNFNFIAGESYQISYALKGQVSDLTWYLTNGLPNQSGTPSPICMSPNAVVPLVPPGSIPLTPSNNDFNSLSNWVVFTTNWIQPASNFSQLWFRGSNLNSPLEILTSHIYVDNVVISIKKDCEFLCPVAFSDLTACPEEEEFGTIVLECNGQYAWDIPSGSSAFDVTSQSSSTLVMADPGIYTVTVTDKKGCTEVHEFEVLSDCCEKKDTCMAPERLFCDYNAGGVDLNWDPVPGAMAYQLTIIFDDDDCGCGSGGPTITQSEIVYDTNFLVSGFFIPCFSWSVIAICSESEKSEPSEVMCFDGSQDCFGNKRAGIRDHQNSRASRSLDVKVYPNPVVETFNFVLDISEETNLMIEIFDINGKQVHQIQEGNLNIGNYEKTWSVNPDLSDGIYFVRFQTNTASSTEMVMLKRAN